MAAILSSPAAAQGVTENTAAAVSSLVANLVNSAEDDNNSFPTHRPSPTIPEIGLGRGISRGISNQTSITASMSTVSGISSNGGLGSVPAVPDLHKRNVSTSVDERMGSGGLTQPLTSPLSNRLQQVLKTNDGIISNDANSIGENPLIGGRVFSPTVATGVQWRPPSSVAFSSQNETVCFLLLLSVSSVFPSSIKINNC